MRKGPRIGLRDWWLLLPPVSIGILTWAAFFYVGIRARNTRWLMWAAIYLGALMGAFALDAAVGQKDWSETFAGFVLFALAGGGFAHGVAIRSQFYGSDDSTEYEIAERRLAAREMGRKMVAEEPDRARQMGVGRPDLRESFDAELADLNSAPASVIASVCGVPKATADRIVEARGDAGFSSVEDLDLLLNLPPAEVAKLHDAGVCVPLD